MSANDLDQKQPSNAAPLSARRCVAERRDLVTSFRASLLEQLASKGRVNLTASETALVDIAVACHLASSVAFARQISGRSSGQDLATASDARSSLMRALRALGLASGDDRAGLATTAEPGTPVTLTPAEWLANRRSSPPLARSDDGADR